MANKYPNPDHNLAKILNKVSIVLTCVVLLTVGLMRQVKFNTGYDFSFLPPVSALLNSFVTLFLLAALFFIKKKDVDSHNKAIFGAMSMSALFLVCYVIYHFTTVETIFCKEGFIRYVYYFFLFTHIVLAGISLPFILFTFVRGYTYQVEKHRAMARWVFPIWLYVAITGPVCYLLLKPCYL